MHSNKGVKNAKKGHYSCKFLQGVLPNARFSDKGRSGMVSRDKLLDDLARLAGGAATLLGEAGKQANENFRSRIDSFAQGIDLVPRADFERLEVMLESALAEIKILKTRIDTLEGVTPKSKPAPKAKPKPKPSKAKAPAAKAKTAKKKG